jgi:hypothetical protein
MKLLKYFFVMAFLASVGSVSAFADGEATGTGEERPGCAGGVGGLASPPADALVTGDTETTPVQAGSADSS